MKEFHVIIIGGGPAGLSAAMYFAKAEYETLVISDGRTLLNSALLDNTYLGITEKLNGEDFHKLATQQVESMGVEIQTGKVTAVREHGEAGEEGEATYEVVTEAGTYVAEFLVFASGISFDTASLAGLELLEHDEPFISKRVKVDERGRTGVRNIYAAGIAAGVASQAIVAAGHGAQVAINVISDVEEERVVIHDKKPRPTAV